MDASPPIKNESHSTDDRERIALLVELRDAFTNEADSLSELRARLEEHSPKQIMSAVVPRLLFAPPEPSATGAEALSSDDALNILGYLVAPSSSVTNESASKYLEAASQVMRSELEQEFRNHERVATGRALHISAKFISILVHQACTGWNVAVAQNSQTSIVLLHHQLLQQSSPETVSFLWNEIVTTWSNAMKSIHVYQSGRTDQAASTICIRCATLTVDLVCQSDRAMQWALEASALTLLLELFQGTSGDPLLQLSVLDLFQTLASTRPLHVIRSQWLLSDAVTQPLLRAAGVSSSSEGSIEADPYLQGPALRVLASLCGCVTMSGAEHSRDGLVDDLLRALRSFDVTEGGELDRLAFIDAVSSLAATSSMALHKILDDAVLRETWLNLSVAQPKLKSAILVSMAHVMDPEEANGPNGLTNEDRMQLYAALATVNRGPNHANSTELLLHLVGSPIPEIRLGVYRLFQAVAQNALGGQVLLTSPPFFDFLLSSSDRMIESTYDGRILKYAIVEAVFRNTTLQQLVSKEIVAQLQQ
jgi:Proteasome non-ATPase 26S subunit